MNQVSGAATPEERLRAILGARHQIFDRDLIGTNELRDRTEREYDDFNTIELMKLGEMQGSTNGRPRSFPTNRARRDLVAGDVHECFGTLEWALADVDFDADHDRFFGVGDLVDRGPRSDQAVDWLERRFAGVTRGNHERLVARLAGGSSGGGQFRRLRTRGVDVSRGRGRGRVAQDRPRRIADTTPPGGGPDGVARCSGNCRSRRLRAGGDVGCVSGQRHPGCCGGRSRGYRWRCRAADGLGTQAVALAAVIAGHGPGRRDPRIGAAADRSAVRAVPPVMPSSLRQDEAVSAALRDVLTVVTGPPGTGKSQVLANVSAAAVCAGQSVLLASKNNQAVDVVVERLRRATSGVVVRSGNRAVRRDAALRLLREMAVDRPVVDVRAVRRQWAAVGRELAAIPTSVPARAALEAERDQLQVALDADDGRWGNVAGASAPADGDAIRAVIARAVTALQEFGRSLGWFRRRRRHSKRLVNARFGVGVGGGCRGGRNSGILG